MRTHSTIAASVRAEATPVTVGMLTSLTGPLGAYGGAYQAGFEAGWDYVTEGDGELDGFDVTFEWVDDQGNPDTAVSQFKDLVGQDVKIVAGSASSGIAAQLAEQAAQNEVLYISGPAATDAITGWAMHRKGRALWQIGERSHKVETHLHPIEQHLTWTNQALEGAA